MDRSMIVKMVCAAAAMCAMAGADEFVPKWRVSRQSAKYVKVEGDKVVVDVPPGVSNVCAYATAEIDLSDWAQCCLEAEVKCRGERVVRDARPGRGVKLSVHYTDAVSRERRYPAAPAPEQGGFDWTNLQLGVTFGEVPPAAEPKAQVVLGLQQTSGRLEFDLSSFKLRKAPPLFPNVDNKYQVKYPAAVMSRGRMRGVMGRGVCRNTEQDIEDLKNYGANLIRLQMNGFQAKRKAGKESTLADWDAWLKRNLDHAEQVLGWLEARGMQMALDMHNPPLGGYGHSGDVFYVQENADAFIEAWRTIARRFKGRKGIYGYDLMNEPAQTRRALPECDYWNIQRRAAEAIRAIDSDVTIIFAANDWSSARAFPYLQALEMDNVIYEVHMYTPGWFTHQGANGAPRPEPGKELAYPNLERGVDKAMLRKWLQPVVDFQRRHNAKIFVGEFSACIYAPGAGRYLRDCISLFEEFGWDWTYHSFREARWWNVETVIDPATGKSVPCKDNDRFHALIDGFNGRDGSFKGAGTAWVDAFDLSGAVCGYGKRVRAGKSVDGNPLVASGKTYERGFGTHPESAILFRSNGKVDAFDALVALDDDAKNAGSGKSYGRPTACFKVWADGRIVWSSGNLKLGQKPVPVHVPLAGAKEIVLETTGGGKWTAFDAANADWLDARFTCSDGALLEVVDDLALRAQLGVLTPKEGPEPRINGADIWGVRPGHPVIFRVATSGARPMKFSAKGLPAGVTLDANGVLRGVAPETPGNYDFEVTASNAKGRAVRTIRLAVGGTIALTPPMGWNSWNTLCYRLTAEKAMAAAKAMHDSGLADHGWAYINLDDWWEMNNSENPRVEMRKKDFGGREDVIGPARDASGKINPNRSFPDMKALTDYIHSFGLKAGLYSSPGPLTCGKCEGSYGHELQDAESWADWGFDYIKYDWCSYNDIFKKETGHSCWDKGVFDDVSLREAFIKPYRLMGECLAKQKRDIVYSFCQYGMAHTETWGAEIGGQCWRSWEDLKDAWVWMEAAVEGRIDAEYWKYSRPGWWADPDMMIVGQQYSFGYDHPSFLTPNEQYTHVSLWAMVGSPLLIGCDLTTMDAFTRNLLVNDEVIAVSQDRLGKVARRIRHTDAESVWTRPLVGGFTAVALVNRYPFAREMKVSFDELGLNGQCWVKDLWRQKCEGKHSGFYVVTVPPHATKLVKMRPVDCRKCD